MHFAGFAARLLGSFSPMTSRVKETRYTGACGEGVLLVLRMSLSRALNNVILSRSCSRCGSQRQNPGTWFRSIRQYTCAECGGIEVVTYVSADWPESFEGAVNFVPEVVADERDINQWQRCDMAQKPAALPPLRSGRKRCGVDRVTADAEPSRRGVSPC